MTPKWEVMTSFIMSVIFLVCTKHIAITYIAMLGDLPRWARCEIYPG